MDRIGIILHTEDRGTLDELAGTTETETQSGRIIYHTPVKDRDHQTDSVRACVRAIERLVSADSGYEVVSEDLELGWMQLQVGEYGW